MSTNTMSPLDASFLHIEDDSSHMHIGSVAIFEGPPLPTRACARWSSRSSRSCRATARRCASCRSGSDGPCGSTTRTSTSIYHVRHTALPTPGGNEELRNLVGRVMSQQLDRSKPLWEMWVVEGLDAGRWALLSKIHHCMVDGVSGTDLLAVMLDQARDPEPPPASDDLAPAPGADLGTDPRRSADRARRQPLRDAAQRARGDARAAAARVAARTRPRAASPSMRGLLRSTQTSLNGPIGPHRRWAWARSQLADVKAVRAALGGTVNDVVLAVITNGFRELLAIARRAGGRPDVRTMVPVSVRSPGERGTYNNRVSAMFAELPVGIADPVERLDSIRAQMEGLKESKQAVAGEVLTSLTGFAPPMLLSLGTRVVHAHSAAQPQHGDDERPGAAVPALRGRPADARGVPVRSARRHRPDRDRDLLLRRHAQLRRHR